MRAILRLEAWWVVRTVLHPVLVAVAACMLIVVYSVARSHDWPPQGRIPGGMLLLALLVQVPLWGLAMAASLRVVDACRWHLPVSPRTTLAAHACFWTTLWIVPAAAFASYCASSWGHAATLLVELLMLAWAILGASLALDWLRGMWRLVQIAILLAAVLPQWPVAVSGQIDGWFAEGGAGVLPIAVAACVFLGVGAWAYLRAEALPAATGSVPEAAPPARWRRAVSVDAAAPGDAAQAATTRRERLEQVTARTPARSILRATLTVFPAGVWAVLAVAFQFLAAPVPAFALTWILMSVVSIARSAATSWRWLLATPIDRDRAFRMLFLPLVLVAATAAAARLLALEVASGDPTTFFLPMGSKASHTRRHEPMVYGQILEVDPQAHDYRRPDPPVMAANVAAHLWNEYRLRVPEARIEATILRGWRTDYSTSNQPRFDEQQAAFDAMERVHTDLAEEIRSADRALSAFHVAVALLLTMLALRLEAGRRLGWWMGWLLAMTPLLVVTRQVVKGVPAVAPVLDAWASVEGAVVASSALQRVAAVLAAMTFGVLLWRSAARAFRRLELTDLPPAAVTR